MKIVHYENLSRSMRQYHRNHPWRLSIDGLYIPHSYDNMASDSLSYWDDVGFILNGRRFIILWQHPRNIYADTLKDLAWRLAGKDPQDDWLLRGATKNYRSVGQSGRRKKLVSYTSRPPSIPQQQFYTKLHAIEDRLTREGIDLSVEPSWKWHRLSWAMRVNLVAPLEVRSEADLAEVARLTKRLVLQQTTLAAQFPNYVYGKQEWACDQATLTARLDGTTRSTAD